MSEYLLLPNLTDCNTKKVVLKKGNLGHNMTNTELIQNMHAEASTEEISNTVNPKSFEESKNLAGQVGNVAKVTLKKLEAKTGKK